MHLCKVWPFFCLFLFWSMLKPIKIPFSLSPIVFLFPLFILPVFVSPSTSCCLPLLLLPHRIFLSHWLHPLIVFPFSPHFTVLFPFLLLNLKFFGLILFFFQLCILLAPFLISVFFCLPTFFSSFRVWEVTTGEVLNTLIHHNEAVLHLRFANGLMVTCSKDRSIAVWDMASPTDISLRRVLVGHRAAVNVVDFDDKYIVSASGDRTIKVSRWRDFPERLLIFCENVNN